MAIVVKVVAVATVGPGSLQQARTRFLLNYSPRVEGAITTRGLTGVVIPRVIERPDLGARVWEFYPKTTLDSDETLPWVENYRETYIDVRDFLRSDLEAWLEAEGHTVHQVFFKEV